MHRGKPVAQLPVGAAPGKNPGLRACWIFLLGAGLLSASAWSAPAPQNKTAAEPAKVASPADFVGAETCATCHEEVAKKFASNPHAKMAQLHGNSGVTCENCHGAGREHVEGGGDTTKIFNPAKASTKEVDAKCLGCHQGKHQNFDRSAHAENNVGCISCHSVHDKGEGTEHLLKAPQPKLCFQCHTDIKSQFSMPFHHKVNEGLIQCSDCHDAHGTNGKKNLLSSAQQDQVCVKCHSEMAGPFVYEHAPIKAEGCTSCHTPHGGPNARLLNRPTVNGLCLQCHSPSPNFSTQSPGHNQNGASYNTCTICHSAIHGSNTSNYFVNAY
jgi:DmsE family decaheme c-type cytochrome